MYIYIYICTYTYVYIYIHTYTYVYITAYWYTGAPRFYKNSLCAAMAEPSFCQFLPLPLVLFPVHSPHVLIALILRGGNDVHTPLNCYVSCGQEPYFGRALLQKIFEGNALIQLALSIELKLVFNMEWQRLFSILYGSCGKEPCFCRAYSRHIRGSLLIVATLYWILILTLYS